MNCMKNKKKGASSKTWAVDCRTDSAFDFALKVLKEAKSKKYPFDLRANFLKIAYSNSLETIAKAQTDPIEFKLKTAMKMFDRNLKEISKVAYDLWKQRKHTCHLDEAIKRYSGTIELKNPYDYIDIDYSRLELALTPHTRVTNDDSVIYNCAKRYNFPKIFIEVQTVDNVGSAILTKLMPTNDIVVNLPLYIAELFDIELSAEHYPEPDNICHKLDAYRNLVIGERKGTPYPALIHVPYDSFYNITNLLHAAALSPDNVKEIGITAYRLGPVSRIVAAIIDATKNEIMCRLYIELSARGEIDRDLDYIVKLLHDADPDYLDIKVQYNGIKVHAKMMYIDLKNGETIGIFSTGNYNESTARVYKDYHYVSTEKSVVEMIKRNFSVLWNSEQPVLSSISNILTKEIYSEIAKGKHGRIWIQANHLDNKHIVTLLKEAIHRGCDVKLIVRTTRGFHNKELKCCKTVIGKYLEHSRVYIFGDRRDRRVYLSSSDILFRNLYNRFESYVKINEYNIATELENDFINLYKNGQR